VNLTKAAALCVKVEAIAPRFGFHVALTGGCLYKPGDRKDVDIVFYEHKSDEPKDKPGLLAALRDEAGILSALDYGRVVKAQYRDAFVDMLFPGFEGQYQTVDKLNPENISQGGTT
jgi:hypothetical protein